MLAFAVIIVVVVIPCSACMHKKIANASHHLSVILC